MMKIQMVLHQVNLALSPVIEGELEKILEELNSDNASEFIQLGTLVVRRSLIAFAVPYRGV